jgi:hypothetical protein
MDRKNINFTTKTKDGKEIELQVVKPGSDVLQKAQIIYASTWQKSINHDPPLLLRAKLDKVLRQQGLWSDDKDNQRTRLLREIRDKRLALVKGGVSTNQAVEDALSIMKLQNELNKLLAERNRIDANTAEAQADNAQFNFLVSECTLNFTNGERYFSSYKDYVDRASESTARDAANQMMYLLYDLDEKASEHSPENVLLKKLGRMDEKGRLVKNDKPVDIDGRYVDDEGKYVDEQGDFIDEDGFKVDKYGYPVVTDTQPFVDENGVSIDISFQE